MAVSRHRLARLSRALDELEKDPEDLAEKAEAYCLNLDLATRGLPHDPTALPAGVGSMNLHAKQLKYWDSLARFRVTVAGRRGGKTELALRRFCKKAVKYRGAFGRWIICAPTLPQVKTIYWEKLKRLLPNWAKIGISESESWIKLWNGTVIRLYGMEKPQRVEGSPVLGALLDEYADMKPIAYSAHVRPTLTDTQGECDFIGVPEGNNHFKETYDRGMSGRATWESFAWWTEEVLPLYLGEELAAEEIAEAKSDMDELTYRQEYQGEFLTYGGLAYYKFSDRNLTKREYDPRFPLSFCFDFNVSPGVAYAVQTDESRNFDYAVGEVYIPRFSNTERICRKLREKYCDHRRGIKIYGDATGGAEHTSGLSGTDWDIIRREMEVQWGEEVEWHVPRENPRERARVNCFNSRLETMSGDVRFYVNPVACPNLAKDLLTVEILEGSDGVIDKQSNKKATHPTDAVGYMLHRKYGGGHGIQSKQM